MDEPRTGGRGGRGADKAKGRRGDGDTRVTPCEERRGRDEARRTQGGGGLGRGGGEGREKREGGGGGGGREREGARKGRGVDRGGESGAALVWGLSVDDRVPTPRRREKRVQRTPGRGRAALGSENKAEKEEKGRHNKPREWRRGDVWKRGGAGGGTQGGTRGGTDTRGGATWATGRGGGGVAGKAGKGVRKRGGW